MLRDFVITNLKAVKQAYKRAPTIVRSEFGRFSADRPTFGLPSAGATLEAHPRNFPGSISDDVPIKIVSPAHGHFMSTFFDVQAFSPSGRYIAVTQVPFVHRIPLPSDRANICVIDLVCGSCKVVYQTKGWGAQLGANVQWGETDDVIFCNDVKEGRPVGVRVSVPSGKSQILGGPVYGLSPDCTYSYSPNLELINALMPGYGIPESIFARKRQHNRASSEDGIWRTNLKTGHCELLCSIADIVHNIEEQAGLNRGTYYVFNTKVNPTNDRLFAVIFSRNVPFRAGRPVQLVTMRLDGSDVKLAMPDRLWRLGGHHPSWHPDGKRILMNLRVEGRMAFVTFCADGTSLTVVAPGKKGSGHPSIDCSGRFLVTDSYISEGFLTNNGTVPLRLIDISQNEERPIAQIFTNRDDSPTRIDPHPVWSPDGNKILFNCFVEGYRQVAVADVSFMQKTPSNVF